MRFSRAAIFAYIGVASVAGCNSIFGVDELELRGPRGSGGQTAQGAGQAGGGANGGGAGGQGQEMRVWTEALEISSANAQAAGYSLSLTLDHLTLVADGSAKVDGSDLRILYDDGSATLVELDRVLDPFSSFNNAKTKIWWRAQVEISKGDSKGAYYLAYNAPGATPKQDPRQVYAVWEDFNDPDNVGGTFTDGSGGGGPESSAVVSGGRLVMTSADTNIGGADDNHAFWYWALKGPFEVDSAIVSVNKPSNQARLGGIMVRTSLQTNAPSHWFGPMGTPQIRGSVTRLTQGANAIELYSDKDDRVPLYCRMRLVGDTMTTAYSFNGSNWSAWPVATFSAQLDGKPVFVGIAHSSESTATASASIDWIRIRVRDVVEPRAKRLAPTRIEWTPGG